MKISCFKSFKFSAAHFLENLPEGHPCGRVHGHNYKLTVEVFGTPDSSGFIMDFHKIKEEVTPLIKKIDHHNINETISPSTSEGIALWFYKNLKKKIPGIISITVKETDTCGAIVREDLG